MPNLIKKPIFTRIMNEIAVRWTPARYLFLFSILLVSANLRAPITSVGPVMPAIQNDLHLSNTAAGLVTTIPLIAFALFSPVAAGSVRYWPIERTLWAAVWTIGIGLSIRIIPSPLTLFVGAALIGAGIAFGNVLMPPLIQQHYPRQIGLVTGLYSLGMAVIATLASGFSIPIGEWTGRGWQGSIGIWLGVAIPTIMLWTRYAIRRQPTGHVGKGPAAHPSSANAGESSPGLTRYRRAWQITIFMGLQSLLFYCAVAWFPRILQDWGMNAKVSGWMLSLVQFTQLPIMLVGPILIGRLRRHHSIVWFVAGTIIISLILLLGWRTRWVVPAAILYGLGTGLAFSLALMWFALRTRHTADAARLSGMAQTLGYLMAAAGPPLLGTLHDWTGTWQMPLAFLLAATLVLLGVGLPVASPSTIGSIAQDRE